VRCIELQAERLGLGANRVPEAVEPAGGIECDEIVATAVGRDETGIDGVGRTFGTRCQGDDAIFVVPDSIPWSPRRRGGVKQLGEVGATQAQEHAERERRARHGGRRLPIVEERRNYLLLYRSWVIVSNLLRCGSLQ
jgi:hypothetical protein